MKWIISSAQQYTKDYSKSSRQKEVTDIIGDEMTLMLVCQLETPSADCPSCHQGPDKFSLVTTQTPFFCRVIPSAHAIKYLKSQQGYTIVLAPAGICA